MARERTRGELAQRAKVNRAIIPACEDRRIVDLKEIRSVLVPLARNCDGKGTVREREVLEALEDD